MRLQHLAERESPGRAGTAVPPAGFSSAGLYIDAGRGAGEQLHDAVRRAARAPQGLMALALHLSRIPPPGPRPYHRRVARAILEDTAQRHDGQVFTLANGDLVLLCRELPPGRPPSARPTPGAAVSDPATLPDTMARLLRADMSDPSGMTTLWRLEESLTGFNDYAIAGRSGTGPPPPQLPPAASAGAVPPGVVDAIAAIAEGSAIADLLQRQTGVLVAASLRQDAAANPSLRPLYREVTFSIDALEARIAAAGQASADPCLFRHLAGRLDRRMLAVLGEAAGSAGVLDVAASRRGGPPLHINLTLPGILSDSFGRFALLCRGAGVTVGIEVSLVEACSDAAAFGRARRLLAESGLALVLDGLSHLALILARPCALRADLVKLDWAARMTDLAADERQQVAAALERIGLHRVVLNRAETEAALRWGLIQGIRRFQGRYVDAMLAAGRTASCPRATLCTLRQCVERAAAIGPAGRAGCAVTRLLDSQPPLGVDAGASRGSTV